MQQGLRLIVFDEKTLNVQLILSTSAFCGAYNHHVLTVQMHCSNSSSNFSGTVVSTKIVDVSNLNSKRCYTTVENK
jgi:hypothetical protein